MMRAEGGMVNTERRIDAAIAEMEREILILHEKCEEIRTDDMLRAVCRCLACVSRTMRLVAAEVRKL